MKRGAETRPGREEAVPLCVTCPERTIMPCPFLRGNYMLSCKALREVYIPSTYELDEYCRHGQHTMCPFYCKREADGRFNFMDEPCAQSDIF